LGMEEGVGPSTIQDWVWVFSLKRKRKVKGRKGKVSEVWKNLYDREKDQNWGIWGNSMRKSAYPFQLRAKIKLNP